MSGIPPVVATHAVFSTTDADEIDQYLTRSYGSGIRLRRCRTDYRMHHERAAAGAVSLDTVSSSGFAAEVPPTGQLMLLLVDAGHITRETAGARQQYDAGSSFVLARPRDAYSVDWRGDPARVRTLTLDVDLLAAVAGVPVSQVSAMTFTGDHLDGPVGQQWRRTVDFAVGSVLTTPADHPVPALLVDAVTRMLAAATLTAFANDLHPATDRPDDRPATLRRAVAYMESRPDQPITLTDIAAAAYVTPRALQLAFRRHLQTTPLAHLQRIRLDRAHADLLAADPERHTVAGIAARWGFADPSRFSAQYRATYGRLPRKTLHS